MGNSGKKRRTFSSKEKVEILKEHLTGGMKVSEVCDKHNLDLNQFYRWQSEFFTLSEDIFDRERSVKPRKEQELEKKVTDLSEKLTRKHEVLSELLEEHVALKKKLGGI